MSDFCGSGFRPTNDSLRNRQYQCYTWKKKKKTLLKFHIRLWIFFVPDFIFQYQRSTFSWCIQCYLHIETIQCTICIDLQWLTRSLWSGCVIGWVRLDHCSHQFGSLKRQLPFNFTQWPALSWSPMKEHQMINNNPCLNNIKGLLWFSVSEVNDGDCPPNCRWSSWTNWKSWLPHSVVVVQAQKMKNLRNSWRSFIRLPYRFVFFALHSSTWEKEKKKFVKLHSEFRFLFVLKSLFGTHLNIIGKTQPLKPFPFLMVNIRQTQVLIMPPLYGITPISAVGHSRNSSY